MKRRKWNAASKDSHLKNKRRYPRCHYVKKLTETIAEVRAAVYKCHLAQKRHRDRHYTRSKRFKADPEGYIAVKKAKAFGGKPEDYLRQTTVDICGRSEGLSEPSLISVSDQKETLLSRNNGYQQAH